MPDATLKITFRREDGTRYTAEMPGDRVVRLVSGETLAWENLEPGDLIESHLSLEGEGSGHEVIG